MLPLIAGVMGINAAASLGNTYLQYKNLEYQKDVQNKIFSREDNSVQRRVADLKAAGLSPVLAAGQGAAAGAPIKTEAPQFETNQLSNALNAMQMQNYEKQMQAIDADISKTHAEQKYIEQQNRKTSLEADKQRMDNQYQEKTGIPANASGPVKWVRDAVGAGAGPIGDAVKGFTNEVKRNIKEPANTHNTHLWDRFFGD